VQDALEAAEAAARVVMDAMEAESAAGRTTPSGGGQQPLEAIQLFEQADSRDVRDLASCFGRSLTPSMPV